jgi:hypothetical protein|nr:MAG TPA: hypothetical protein [Caudoviricetes sp.]
MLKNRKKKFLEEVTTTLIWGCKGGVGVYVQNILHYPLVYIV